MSASTSPETHLPYSSSSGGLTGTGGAGRVGRGRCPGCGCALALDSNTARQALPSEAAFCRRHATIRLTSGIWSPHSPITSGVQAICCSKVPRYSSAGAEFCVTIAPPVAIARLRTMRRARMPDPLLKFNERAGARRMAPNLPNRLGPRKVLVTQLNVSDPAYAAKSIIQ